MLKRYQITYNYDEFYQLLLIQLWHLTHNYQPSKSHKLSSYLFIRLNYYLIDIFRKENIIRLNYYLIDIFRKENKKLSTINIDTTVYSKNEPIQFLNEDALLLQDIYYLLNNQEKQWLDLKLLGYKQFEIENIMHLSISTIKKIKKVTQSKIMQHLQYNLEKE